MSKAKPKRGCLTSYLGIAALFALVALVVTVTGSGNRSAPHASATPRPTAITLPTPTPTATLDAAGLRQRRLAAGFSAWDGSHIALTRAIKAAMHDPSSYQHVDTTYIDRGDYLVVTTTYRGRNAFGAIVEHSITAHTDLDGAIIRIVAQTP